LPVEEQNRIADRAETKGKKGILFSQSETIVNVELALLAQKLLFSPLFGTKRASRDARIPLQLKKNRSVREET